MNDTIDTKTCRELRTAVSSAVENRIEKVDGNVNKLHTKIDNIMKDIYNNFVSKFMLTIILTGVSGAFGFLGYLSYKTFDISTQNTQVIYEIKTEIMKINHTLKDYKKL